MAPSELLLHVARALHELGLRYLVTGSMATVFFGEPRFTNDIDVVVDLPPGRIPGLCSKFPSPAFYVDEFAVREAVRNRGQFNIIHAESGLKIDIMIADDSPFNQSRFARCVKGRVSPSASVHFASPEDVIIKKLEYHRQGGSDKHLRDIAGILRVMPTEIDYAYIDNWTTRLGLADHWAAVTRQLPRGDDNAAD
jgi:hypothetical protein